MNQINYDRVYLQKINSLLIKSYLTFIKNENQIKKKKINETNELKKKL